jgi:cation diffusion facilitator family transporter
MNKQSGALISIISNTSLVIFKIISGLAMGSVSVLSEAIHSGIDLIASLVAYFSIRKSIEPADSEHPYGHGKFENISGFFEAILIFVAAGMILIEAFKKLLHPASVEKLDWGIAVMLISTIINAIVSIKLFKIAKKENSIALEADAMHLSVDVFTSLGVLVGLIIIRFTGLNIIDPVIALLVAGMILKASWDLTRKSLDDLADKSLPENELALIKAILAKYPQIKGFHKLRSRKSGNRRELDFHIKIDKSTLLENAHNLCDLVEADIKKLLPNINILIHVEPMRIKETENVIR